VKTYVLVENGVVTNIIVWDGNTDAWSAPEGSEALEDTWGAGIGWTYDGQKCLPPS
jgi:hypothetical protein